MISKHYENTRENRQQFIKEHFDNDGIMIDGFIVDRGHKNGLEVHSITDKGLIIIHNLYSGVLVTKLIARPQQIMRYYKDSGRVPPPEYEKVLELARLHNILGYNDM